MLSHKNGHDLRFLTTLGYLELTLRRSSCILAGENIVPGKMKAKGGA